MHGKVSRAADVPFQSFLHSDHIDAELIAVPCADRAKCFLCGETDAATIVDDKEPEEPSCRFFP